jgi:tRNA A37 threonylcarbamoyltransferase TsaD
MKAITLSGEGINADNIKKIIKKMLAGKTDKDTLVHAVIDRNGNKIHAGLKIITKEIILSDEGGVRPKLASKSYLSKIGEMEFRGTF